jgi:hypothetical protein
MIAWLVPLNDAHDSGASLPPLTDHLRACLRYPHLGRSWNNFLGIGCAHQKIEQRARLLQPIERDPLSEGGRALLPGDYLSISRACGQARGSAVQ